jgi:hypothetical protein
MERSYSLVHTRFRTKIENFDFAWSPDAPSQLTVSRVVLATGIVVRAEAQCAMDTSYNELDILVAKNHNLLSICAIYE